MSVGLSNCAIISFLDITLGLEKIIDCFVDTLSFIGNDREVIILGVSHVTIEPLPLLVKNCPDSP